MFRKDKKNLLHLRAREITKGGVKMNDIEKPSNRTEAANTIYEIIKEFYGDCTSVNIFVNCSGMDIELTENPLQLNDL